MVAAQSIPLFLLATPIFLGLILTTPRWPFLNVSEIKSPFFYFLSAFRLWPRGSFCHFHCQGHGGYKSVGGETARGSFAIAIAKAMGATKVWVEKLPDS